MTLERKGERLAVDQASQPRPPGGGAFLAPNMSQTQIIANSHRVFGHLAFFGQPAKCEAAHTSFPLAPLKSAIATSIWRREGYMAPKPKPARFVFTVGMVLAMALTILTITADRDLAAPSSSAVYHPQLLLLY